MDRRKAEEILLRDNPRAPQQVVAMYASAFATWWEAEENVRKNGAICAHPRTGAPLENPYLKVREAAQRSLAAIKARLQTDRLWREAEEDATSPKPSETT